ncbi:hypothetical protein [Mucilaginibacter sp. UR6-11]|uniref:hypothetical protein n=1 Tax=Mucilaginibacter sp. UR6-11 TaxID=1435644 RepID=UPI001E3DC6EB|nr:hypothetical protein [Mucilaginibacter sp. UR6-11]MCC8426249.1 hypothetical protein [Mucilaginibacter sp. UR6-11]
MTDPINYTIYIDGEEHNITITPVNQNIPGGDIYVTGVFRLTEGNVGMGDIIFDDNMNQWEYTGMGDFTHQSAAEIAGFIQAKNALSASF